MQKKETVFKNKNFLLLFQGTLTSNIAATFYSFALSFYILEITNNNASLQGVYLAVCGITFVIFSFVGGVLADRWNKVKIIYMSDFIKGILILIASIPMYLFIKEGNALVQLIIIFLIGIINNIIAAIFSPASMALMPELVERDLLQQANSYFSMLASFVSIVGIIVAGILYSYLTIILLFVIVGLLYVASGVSELFIKVKHTKKKEVITFKVILSDFAIGLKTLWNLKPIFYIIAGALFLNFFFTPFYANLLPYIIKTDVTTSNYLFKKYIDPEVWMSILSALFGGGSLIMALIISRKAQKEKQGKSIKVNLAIMTLVAALMCASYLLFVKSNINVMLITFSILMLIIGVSSVGVNIPISVATQKNIPEGMLAKVGSVMNIGSMGLTPFASLLGGLVISFFGSGALFIFITLGLIIVTILFVLSKEISNI